MEILLLNNGRGIIRGEVSHFTAGKITVKFIGAPAGSVVTVDCNNHVFRRVLSEKKRLELDVSDMRGEIKLTVVSGAKVWHCDEIHVVKDKSGGVKVTVLPNYSDNFAAIFNELSELRESLDAVKAEIAEICSELSAANKEYDII